MLGGQLTLERHVCMHAPHRIACTPLRRAWPGVSPVRMVRCASQRADSFSMSISRLSWLLPRCGSGCGSSIAAPPCRPFAAELQAPPAPLCVRCGCREGLRGTGRYLCFGGGGKAAGFGAACPTAHIWLHPAAALPAVDHRTWIARQALQSGLRRGGKAGIPSWRSPANGALGRTPASLLTLRKCSTLCLQGPAMCGWSRAVRYSSGRLAVLCVRSLRSVAQSCHLCGRLHAETAC